MNRVRSARRTRENRESTKNRAAEGNKARRLGWQRWTCVLALFVVNWIAYSNSFRTGWHFDDGPNIVGNSDIAIADLSWKSLSQAASSQPGGKRPVSYLSFALNYHFFGEDPFSFHVVNFLIHCLNALLVFRIFSVLIARATESGDGVVFLPTLAAALWAVNPIQTQPVVYVVQRMTLLSAFFSLLSFSFFIQWRSRTRGHWYLVLSFAAWLMAVGSKENAFLLPVTFLAYEWLFTDRSLLRPKYLAVGLIMFACFGGFTLKRYDLVKRIEIDYSRREFTMKERLLTQPRIVTFHVSQLLAPLPSRLALRHEVEKSTSWLNPPTTVLSILLLGALFAGGTLVRKQEPLICFGVLWFFANLIVESSFLPLEMIYEHRIYLPSIGLFLALVQFAKCALTRWSKISQRQLNYMIGFLVICSCGLSFARIQAWQDEVSLWSDNVQKYPSSFRAWNNLGIAYAKSGESSEAERAFRQAVDREPEYPPARVNLAVLLKDQERLEEAFSLIEHLQESKIGTFSAEVYYNMGAIFARKGLLDRAIFHYGQAVNRMPDYAEAHFNLALVYRRAGRNAEARESFQRFLNHWRGSLDSPFVAEAKRSLLDLQ